MELEKGIIGVDKLEFYIFKIRDASGNVKEVNLHEELAYSELTIETDMMQHASKYVYWASLLEKLKAYQESYELDLEVVEAKLDQEARNHFKASGEKPTKDSVEYYMKRRPEWREAKEKVRNQSYAVNHVARIVRAFEQRTSMLQQSSASIRREKEHGQGAGSKIINN